MRREVGGLLREHAGDQTARMRVGVHIVRFGTPGGDDAFLATMQARAAVGVEEVHVIPGAEPAAFIEQLGESLLPRLIEL